MTIQDHVRIEDHHSLLLLVPLTNEARAWLDEHTDGCWLGDYGLAVEHRYAASLLWGLAEGLGLPPEDHVVHYPSGRVTRALPEA